jgi:uncharacterized protein (DUF433 family)
MKHTATKLVRETVGGEPYEYYPLGRYVVAAPGVCGGRPTFKYTRLEAAVILDLLASGWTVEQVVHEYAGGSGAAGERRLGGHGHPRETGA